MRDGSSILRIRRKDDQYERRKELGRAKPRYYIPETVVREEQWMKFRAAYKRAEEAETGLTFAEWVRRACDAYSD